MKIGDFGLVKEGTLDSFFESADIQKYEHGTTFYRSPEQWKDDNKYPITKKVDIYALGIILFELLYPTSSTSERKTVRSIIM